MFKIIYYYLLFYLKVVFHELIHALFAKLFNFNIQKISLGTNFMKININIFSISPIIGNSYVEVDYSKIIIAKRKEIIIFYLAPTVTSIIFVFFSVFI